VALRNALASVAFPMPHSWQHSGENSGILLLALADSLK
jgi:hypothetical protein